MTLRLLHRQSVATLLSVCYFVLFAAYTTWRGSWRGPLGRNFTLFDDPMANMSYARTWQETGVPTWFPGASLLEGSTPTAYTFIMSLIHGFASDSNTRIIAVAGIGVISLTSLALIAGPLFKTAFPRHASYAWIAPIGIALCYPLLFWSVRGFETGLIAALLALAAFTLIKAFILAPRSASSTEARSRLRNNQVFWVLLG